MSSWEEYKKKREEESSWARYKKQRESENATTKSNNVSRATVGQNLINSLPTSNRNRKTTIVERRKSLWENIQDFVHQTAGATENLLLGGSVGVKKSINYSYKTGESRLKSQDEIQRTRVLNSKDLTDNEKNTFILQQQNKLIKKDNNDNNNVIKTILPTKEAKYNEEKVSQIASESLLDKSIREDEEKIQENIKKQTNPVLRKIAELAPSIGNMAVGTVLSGLNPGVGISYFTTSAAGSYMQDALDRGMTQEEATNYGAIMGLMEGATEMIGVENLSKAGKGIKTLIKGSSNNTVKETGKNTIKTVLKDYGIGIADNVMQESLIEPISEIAAGIVGGKDKANFENIGQRMLESGINGGLTSAIVGGANLGIQSCVGVIEKTRNGSTVTQEELKTAVKDASKQLDVEKMIVDSTQQQVEKYKISNNNIETQQENVYNNLERESGVDEQIQRGRMAELSRQYDTRIQQDSKQQQNRQYTRQEYEQWERNITQTEENKLTSEQKQIKEDIKRQYNKDIVFFDVNENTNYNAGASLIDKNKIYINSKQAETFGINKVIYHEIAESNILHNRKISNDIIQPAIEKIINDTNFESQKQVFWNNQEDVMPSDYAIAKDILCDRFAESKTGEKLDYENILSQETNMTIDYAIENFEEQLNNSKKVKLPTQENILPYNTSQNINKDNKITEIEFPINQKNDEITLFDYLDKRHINYETDEDGKIISIENKKAINDYFIEKHRREAIQKQKNQETKIEDNYKTDLEAFKEETNKLNLPTSENINYDINTELLTDEDYAVLNEIYEKEGRTEILTEKRKAKLLEKYANDKYTFKNSLDILAQKFINKGHFVDKLSEQTNNPELKFLYDRNLNSFAEGQYVIGVAQTDNDGNQIGKSINDIWKPVEDANQTKEFSEYLLHKLNIDRSERNKFVFGEEIGPAESTRKALDLETKHPEFKRYAQDIKNFNHNNLLNLKEAGLITQETIDYLEKLYPYYVPISRDKDGKTFAGKSDSTGTNLPIKKATGGNSDIQPIKDTMAQQAIRIKRLINQNKLGQELAKTLKNAKIEQQADIQYTPDALMEYDTLVEADNKGNKYYTYFEDGYMQKLKISDELYESLKPTKISDLEKTLPVKALQKITNIHRSLLTSSNPVFIVSNFFKDIQDGMFNSKYSSKFIKNYGKALHEIITKGKYYESYMANGGMTNTYFDYNEGIKNKRNKFVEKIRSTNEIVEQLPRLSEFISTLEDGKSLNEALYNAAEITTNFKRGGEITKAINRNGVNFLNASIQGLDKQFRNFSGQNGAKGYANLLLKATLLGVVPSVLNYILLGDDEDYEDLPENTKDLYYLFKYDDNKFVRIPKGRVLSIFGSSARRVLEALQGKENSFDGFTDTLINQMAPNNPLEDNILAPILQVKNNRTWYGEDLVSSRLQKELPKNQYNETTDEFSKWIGKQLNVSPKKINYLIDQYSGGLGDVVLPMMTPQAKQNVFKDKFTTDSIMKNKNVSKFYETLEKQSQIANDSFATNEDRLQSQYLNEISSEMSDLYKEKREIQMSDISNSEKTEKVRKIQEKINELAEQGLSEYSSGTYKKNSAKIGDIEYYKDRKGEWTKLTEEEISKNKNISTETYATYKQKIYKETQSKRKSGELSENQNLKTADKIQILLDSNYSEKEIGAIYENYIKSENDTEYNIMKTAGIDTKEYLKYKQQEFTSDKKDDGTLNGKTVSKSKQKKVVEYLNSMKITGNQRLLLYAMQGYSTTSSQKKQLANYVQGLKLDKDTKLKLYDKFSGFKVYKDGRVTW